MYTREYDDGIPTSLPEGYSGTMLSEERKDEREDTKAEPVSSSPLGFLEKLKGNPLTSLFGGFGKGEFKLGIEEILIGATALFHLFSKDGDKECGIMLLLLLFIT